MKWIIYRFWVCWYHWRAIGCSGYNLFSCWQYAENFKETYFDCVEWKSIRFDAKEAVAEDLTYWTE